MEKKLNKKQIILLIILLIILIVAVIANIYVWSINSETEPSSNHSNMSIEEPKKVVNESNTQNQTTNTTIQNKSNSTEDSIVVNLNEDVNIDELKEFFQKYSLGIQRISFDSKSNKSSLNVDTNYAATLENVHKYLSELTGKDYSNVEYIKSYKNYIAYSSNSNSYIYGKDYELITREKYKCTDVLITDTSNGMYTAVAHVTRTLNKQNTNFELTFTFTFISGYSYEQFCVKSLKVKNTSFYPDNTVHFVENPVEEDGNN